MKIEWISSAIMVVVVFGLVGWVEKRYFSKMNIIARYLLGALLIGVFGLIIWGIFKYVFGIDLKGLA